MRILPLIFFLILASASGQNWPQPSGPDGNWRVTVENEPPVSFSVANKENIIWTLDLPEGGQSGITIWGDRIFLTTMKPVASENKKDLKGNTVVALCVDADSGALLWQRELEGSALSPYMYGFSDSTTPGPVTDGEKVWFFNASGNISCMDYDGNLLWQRRWDPIEKLDGVKFPFNKQFEPFLNGDTLVNMETYYVEDGERVYGWNYLYGLNKDTGDIEWISEDGLTHYNTPFYSMDALGKPTALIGRGGHHRVPEKPDGYSMIDLTNGKTIWRYEVSKGDSLYHSAFNKDYAVWYTEKNNEIHLLNAQTGEKIKTISLIENVDVHMYDMEKKAYVSRNGINLKAKLGYNVFPAWYSNIIIDGQLYFMCFKEGRHRKGIGPEYSFSRVNLDTGRVEYLQVPVAKQDGNYIWNTELSTETTNSRGLDVASDKRSKRDGWHWCFNGNPIAINDKIYYTLMLGNCYVLDAAADDFSPDALLSLNDLGPLGKSWSLNTPSFTDGRLYHRTLKQLICVGE